MSDAVTKGMLGLHDYIKTLTIQSIHGDIPFVPFDFQTAAIQHIEDNPLVALSCARQLGHSTCVMAWALWTAAARPGSKIIVMSNSVAQAVEHLDRVRFMITTGVAAIPYVTEIVKNRVAFNNGSSITARAACELKDDDEYTHIIIMNAGWIFRLGTIWPSISLHLDRGMRCVLQGGGGATGSQFHAVVKNAAQNGFSYLSQDWRVHPGRDDAWAEPYRLNLGQARFAMEFENVFLASED